MTTIRGLHDLRYLGDIDLETLPDKTLIIGRRPGEVQTPSLDLAKMYQRIRHGRFQDETRTHEEAKVILTGAVHMTKGAAWQYARDFGLEVDGDYSEGEALLLSVSNIAQTREGVFDTLIDPQMPRVEDGRLLFPYGVNGAFIGAPGVDRTHCTLTSVEGGVLVRDVGSERGTGVGENTLETLVAVGGSGRTAKVVSIMADQLIPHPQSNRGEMQAPEFYTVAIAPVALRMNYTFDVLPF